MAQPGPGAGRSDVSALRARSPALLTAELVARIASLPRPARVLLDGVGAQEIGEALDAGLRGAGRLPVQIRSSDFYRPAGVRLEYGHHDAQAFADLWLDEGALRREVLTAQDSYLPTLWDADRDRSTRAARLPLRPATVLLVAGVLLLGRDLPADLTVHVSVSPAALLRRGVPPWQLPAFAGYSERVRPAERCQVLIRAEDPLRPAVQHRS